MNIILTTYLIENPNLTGIPYLFDPYHLLHHRLSYHQRIVESVPENFEPLLPKKPGPVNKFKMEKAATHVGCTESYRLIDAFKSKANAEEIINVLKEFFVTKDDDRMDGM